MRLVCISDTHLQTPGDWPIPDGDVLIHCGDATLSGRQEEISAFSQWFWKQPHEHKIFIPGNHDWGFQEHLDRALNLMPDKCKVLLGIPGILEIDGVKFWGSPWQPEFNQWAFNLQRGSQLRKHWELIPDGIDVLITHSPPMLIGDLVPQEIKWGGHVGCADLRQALFRVKPKYHIFGHIHGGYGVHKDPDFPNTTFVNCSTCDEMYNPTNPPVVIDL